MTPPSSRVTDATGRGPCARRVAGGAWLALLGVAVAAYAISHLSFFLDLGRVEEDAAAQLHLFAARDKKDPFRDDFLSRYMREAFVTPGLAGLYRLIPGDSPVARARVVWAAGVLAAVASVVAIGARLGGFPVAAFSGIVLLNARQVMRPFATGLARAAGFPLCALFLWALVRRRIGVALAVLGAEALLYPTAFVVCAPTLVLWLLWRLRAREGRARAVREALASGVVLVVCLAGLRLDGARRERALGPVVTLDEARGRPEFRAGGRWPQLPFRGPAAEIYGAAALPFQGAYRSEWPSTAGWNRTHGKPLAAGLFIATGVAMVASRRARAAVPGTVWLFGACAIAVYFLARHIAFRLYVPRLVLHYSLPLVAIVAVPAVLGALGAGKNEGVGSRARHAILAGLLVPYFLLQGFGVRPADDLLVDLRALPLPWRALGATPPPGSLVAADPAIAHAIPIVAGKPVFASLEAAVPLYPRMYREIEKRLREYYEATLTGSRADFEDFVRRNRIDFIVVHDEAEARRIRRREPVPRPFAGLVERLARRVPPGERAISRYSTMLPREREGGAVLVDVRPIRHEAWTGAQTPEPAPGGGG